jgi:hypothetical protein
VVDAHVGPLATNVVIDVQAAILGQSSADEHAAILE